MRAAIRLLTVAALVASALLVPTVGSAPSATARAADTRLFDAGNIISDAVFFDALSMNAAAVQTFLQAKGADCVAGEMPCLKDYRQDTADQAADTLCKGYRGARQETAATIITKAAASCGVNPRVMLVLLQKEQSLVTRTRPTRYAYTKATGFACPDSAPCNPAFSGIASQVYFAARQFQRYRVEAWRYGYKAGRDNAIQWHPNLACGRSTVFLANQATAGLYNYTPYRPNQAALEAQTGTGDACSSYGNRNFWNYFTTWFGSTQSSGGTAIFDAYNAMGGATSWLGPATSGYICGLVRGGCFQNFRSGAIYYSPASGAHAVHGGIGAAWARQGWEKGALGYPTGEEICGLVRGGCVQAFQTAVLYYSADTGVHPVKPPMTAGYRARNFERGVLGYPTGAQVCGLVNGGCFQPFQGGVLYAGPAGTFPVRTAILGTWGSLGWERGWMGYPTGDDNCGTASTGCRQTFQNGTMYWSPRTGAQPVRGIIAAQWLARGGPTGLLGYPSSREVCGLVREGCFQNFANGSMYYSPASGAHPVRGAIRAAWGALGWERGALGYPTADDTCRSDGASCQQRFENGTVYWSAATGAHAVRGDIAARWTAVGGPTGALGYPTGDQICGLVRGGCFQTFAKGSIYASPATGAHVVSGPIRDFWAARRWEAGPLGYPKEDPRPVTGGTAQRFEGGTLTLNAATGVVKQS